MKDIRITEFVWAFRNPKEIDIVGKAKKIKIDSMEYYITALKSRVWITNVMVERALNFKGKKTLYLHTTHTTLPKKMALDSENGKDFKTKNKFQYDYSCAQSILEANLQLSMFGLKHSQILLYGYPKNDLLVHNDKTEQINVRKKIGIPIDKKIILYAPTYREENPNIMISNVDFNKWYSILGDNYYVLYRAHPTVSNLTSLKKYKNFIIDVSNYPNNIDLMIASDILISDYSGIFFEYAVTGKPMYCYSYDYDDYVKSRQLYFDIRKIIPGRNVIRNRFIKSNKKRVK